MPETLVRVGDTDRTIQDVEERLEAIEAEMREIHLEAGDGDLDDEQRSSWEELESESGELSVALRRARRAERLRQSRSRWASVQVGVRKQNPFDGDVRTMREEQVLDRVRSLLDSPESAGHLRDGQKTKVEKVARTRTSDLDGDHVGRMILATENPHYRSAFQKVAASMQPAFTSEETQAIEHVRMVKRAASLTTTAGGFAVPSFIDPTIILTSQGSANDILRLARVEMITNDTWRGISSAGVSWQFNAEAAATTDNAPTIAQPSITARRADGFIPYSIEIGMDWPGFAEQMSGLLAEGYDELLASTLTTGTNGSNQPDGLVSSLDATATIETELATAGTLVAADVYDLWNALPQRFRRSPNCAWMSSTDVQNTLRQLGTVDPNFTVDITQEAIPRLFGRQYPMNDYMQDMPSGTGTQALLVVGDFRGYVVAQRAGMTVEFVPMLFDVTNNRPTGQRGWFAWARVGGGVVNSTGFRLLVNRSA